jgi:hypothetical protein
MRAREGVNPVVRFLMVMALVGVEGCRCGAGASAPPPGVEDPTPKPDEDGGAEPAPSVEDPTPTPDEDGGEEPTPRLAP